MTLSEMVEALRRAHVRTLLVQTDGKVQADATVRGTILAGAFNPLHAGHRNLLEAARAHSGLPPYFELSVVNADKGTLETGEVLRRSEQFAGRHALLLSREPLFTTKAERYPGSMFVVGYDTAIRLVAPRYYNGAAGMQAAFERVRRTGCRFIVAGRLHQGRFRTLQDIEMPAEIAECFIELPDFRVDLSSTELRQKTSNE
jgi:hypothetical protein